MNRMMDDMLNALQWPAMVLTLLSAWMVGSQSSRKRAWGFWLFLGSNVLWVAWGWHDGAIALIVLQLGLFAMNLRGVIKNDAEAAAPNKP